MAADRWDEYRFVIEDTQQISARRQSNNNVYLSANSIVLGAAAFLVAQGALRNAMMLVVLLAIALAGITIAWEWGRQNLNYRKYLEFRYNLLHDMEKREDFPFPVAVFHSEDAMYKDETGKITHFGFSETEQRLANVFGILYGIGVVSVLGVFVFVAVTNQWASWGVTWPH
jgi:hypothetical protein